MIIRAWRAQALPKNVDTYARHLQDAVLPALRMVAGYRGAYLLKREAGTQVELQVLTLWDSIHSIRKFAGSNVDRAVVEPAAQAVLEQFDSTVQHYEVVLWTVEHLTSGWSELAASRFGAEI